MRARGSFPDYLIIIAKWVYYLLDSSVKAGESPVPAAVRAGASIIEFGLKCTFRFNSVAIAGNVLCFEGVPSSFAVWLLLAVYPH
jgi:hypothetical protein